MRICLICPCMALVLACFAFGQQPSQPKPAEKGGAAEQSSSASVPPSLSDILESRIRASWAAFKNRDKKTYGELLADDYVAVEADGEGERNKWHILREIEHSMITDYTLSFLKVTPLASDAAFVRYEAFFRFPPKSAVPFEKVLIGEIWVKREGQWKALHYQETRVR